MPPAEPSASSSSSSSNNPTAASSSGATVTVVWHGRNGRGGQDKGIFSTNIEPQVLVVSDAAVKKGRLATPGRTLKLYPGVNVGVAESDWKKLGEIEAVKAHLAARNLEVVTGIDDSLASIEPHRAIADFAKYTIDLDLLSRWLRAEKRPDVRKAIEDQIAELNQRPAAPKQ